MYNNLGLSSAIKIGREYTFAIVEVQSLLSEEVAASVQRKDRIDVLRTLWQQHYRSVQNVKKVFGGEGANSRVGHRLDWQTI